MFKREHGLLQSGINLLWGRTPQPYSGSLRALLGDFQPARPIGQCEVLSVLYFWPFGAGDQPLPQQCLDSPLRDVQGLTWSQEPNM